MNTTTRRILSTAAATGLVSLTTVLPATAKPEECNAPSACSSGVIQVPVDDNAWEYAQIGLGALAGATAVGAAAVALRRREHHTPLPA